MDYRVLALDIDGTLLNSKSELTPRTKAAVLRAKELGVRVVLATGRRLANTLPYLNELGLRSAVVVHNGAVIYEPTSDRILRQQAIDRDLAQDIVDKLDQLGINYLVYTGESAGERVVAPEGSWQEPEDLLGTYLGERVEFLDRVALATPPIRISLIDQTDRVDAFFAEYQVTYGGLLMALSFGTKNNVWRGIELLPRHCSKGASLALVVEQLGFGAHEVIAIGDNVNDVEMIAWAGMGIAMESGSDQLKSIAKRVAPPHDQDGVAKIIEELLF